MVVTPRPNGRQDFGTRRRTLGVCPAGSDGPDWIQPKEIIMPTAIILLKIDHRKVTRTAEVLLDMPGVTDVYSVSGRYDLLVIIKCDSLDMIESLITDQLLKIEGIVDSETMFAFRSYDKREGGKAIDVD
jgi:DNA-binding Lrp family transcriptional regulator